MFKSQTKTSATAVMYLYNTCGDNPTCTWLLLFVMYTQQTRKYTRLYFDTLVIWCIKLLIKRHRLHADTYSIIHHVTRVVWNICICICILYVVEPNLWFLYNGMYKYVWVCKQGQSIKSLKVHPLKGHCLIFLSAIYQLFIEYFNIK